MSDLTLRLSQEKAKLVRAELQALTGSAPETLWSQTVKRRLADELFECVREAFLQKSSGTIGSDGIVWKPLKRETIAQRPTGMASLDNLKRGLLTDAQDKRWRMIFATRKAWFRLKHGMSDAESSASAAQVAWATLKAEGAKTKLEFLGGRLVPIGIDSGDLWRSLHIKEENDEIVISANVPYAGAFHKKRPLWPEKLPEAWSVRLSAILEEGIKELVSLA